jgi:hypothetical protein
MLLTVTTVDRGLTYQQKRCWLKLALTFAIVTIQLFLKRSTADARTVALKLFNPVVQTVP